MMPTLLGKTPWLGSANTRRWRFGSRAVRCGPLRSPIHTSDSTNAVLTPEDVSLAIAHGADGVLISNHGGRQLDGVPATLDALRECAPVAANKIKIAVDGGIRRGSDIFKALALGADFCFAGRIPIWGLAVRLNVGPTFVYKF